MKKIFLSFLFSFLSFTILAADSPIPPSNGGTGKNNGSNTITVGGNISTQGALTVSGAYPLTLNLSGSTNVTFPTSGTLSTAAGSVPSIQGSTNQVLVNGTVGSPVSGTAITLTLPQFIGTSSSPQFQAITLSGSGLAINMRNDTVTSGQNLGPINFLGLNDASSTVFYGQVLGSIVNNAAANADGKMTFKVAQNGISTEYLNIDGDIQAINLLKNVNISYLSASSVVTTDSSKNLQTVSQLPLSQGGTNANLTASNGGILYSTGSAAAILSGTATAGKVLQSGASAAPSWSTPTYPSASGSAGKVLRSDGTNNVYSTATFADSYTASNILYSNGSNTIQGLTTANNGVLTTDGSGVPSIASTLPNAVQDNITRLGTLSTGFTSTGQPAVIRSSVSATQNISNNTVTGVTIWDTSVQNQGGISYSSGVFTINTPGFYFININFSFAANSTGIRELWIQKNSDTALYAPISINAVTGGIPTRQNISGLMYLNTSDTIQAYVYQTSGSTLSCGGGNLDPNGQTISIIKLF